MKVKSESGVAQSCPTLSDPMDCSLPGSSVHDIFQARVLEWGAIAFSSDRTLGQWKYSHSVLELFFVGFLHNNLDTGIIPEEKAMAAHSSTLAWQIPWTEEPGRLQSIGSLRVGHD